MPIKKSFTVVTLDEAHASLRKDMSPPAPAAAAPPRRRQRQTEIGTRKMTPVSNAEAAQNLRSGKFREKSLKMSIKDLQRSLKKSSKGAYMTAQSAAYAATTKADKTNKPADHAAAAKLHGVAAGHAAGLSTSNYKHHQGLQREHQQAASVKPKMPKK